MSTEAEAAESAAMAAVMAAAAVLSVAEPDALRTHPPRSRSYRGRAAYAPSATSGPSASVALGCLQASQRLWVCLAGRGLQRATSSRHILEALRVSRAVKHVLHLIVQEAGKDG